ncbi:DUF6415 family natural product biosynthesis protein [Streptomyces sp. NPDC051452]|uniref:DUF6415 family natural product biosynthesis protein n=1 Tax=Streptomyces sp. NPDC051452 TaxID=3365654 RepID=UPI0037B46EC3
MTHDTAPARGNAPRAKMTLRVYTVDRYGAVTAERPTVRVLEEGRTVLSPVDVRTMRETARLLLGPDAAPDGLPPSAGELEVLALALRGHLALLIPEVEQAAERVGRGSVAGYGALSCAWEARSRLEAQPGRRYGGAVGHARRLARVLNLLCDQYESLTGRAR